MHASLLACLTGVEPVTHSLEGCCSIQLSYRHRYQVAFVGVARLELATFCTQNRHATSCATPRTLNDMRLRKMRFAYFQKGRKYTAHDFVLQAFC